ncbi:unnamed protein product [Anisakis simplex]|uniref:Uncharacterized protein n=1 Tax=Anisakis simplex TaxID=6269 RepID=A0A0M3J9X7_ANISI|nr:unnamed protein product [Anisakis simplex]
MNAFIKLKWKGCGDLLGNETQMVFYCVGVIVLVCFGVRVRKMDTACLACLRNYAEKRQQLFLIDIGCSFRSAKRSSLSSSRRRFSSSPSYKLSESHQIRLNQSDHSASSGIMIVDRDDSLRSSTTTPTSITPHSTTTSQMPPENEILNAFEDVLVSA